MNVIKRAPDSVPVSTNVFDKGRRGNPLPGCDCVQCFGYCMVNQHIADNQCKDVPKAWNGRLGVGKRIVYNGSYDEAVEISLLARRIA